MMLEVYEEPIFDTGSRISHSHKLNSVSFLPSQVESNKSPRSHR